MEKARGNRRTQQSVGNSKSGEASLEKAAAAEKRALVTVTEVHHKLTNAIRILVTAKTGGAKEDKAERVVRAATKDLLAAKKKLRKAQKKRKKAAALRDARKRSTAAAAKESKPAPTVQPAPDVKRRPKVKPHRPKSLRAHVAVRPTASAQANPEVTHSASTAAVTAAIPANAEDADRR